jgi:uncharacterized OB-fold protein
MEKRPDRTLGAGHDEFWAWCGQGELRLQRCADCGNLSWPVTPACEVCGGTDRTWERMSGRGKIASWCSFERDYYAGLLPIPWMTILVELEEGPLFISNPMDFGEADISAGMPVSLAFIDCEDKAGAFRLPVFRHASGLSAMAPQRP